MGSDTPDGEHYDAVQRFQSTPPAWGATVRLYFPLNVRRISIHAPPHGERRENRLRLKPNGYISIHAPRMGSDVVVVEFFRRESISIHAPAWGATRRSRRAYPCDLISIHAPAWGAAIVRYLRLELRYISIHAPAWGAACRSVRFPRALIYFNPRSRMGSGM